MSIILSVADETLFFLGLFFLGSLRNGTSLLVYHHLDKLAMLCLELENEFSLTLGPSNSKHYNVVSCPDEFVFCILL